MGKLKRDGRYVEPKCNKTEATREICYYIGGYSLSFAVYVLFVEPSVGARVNFRLISDNDVAYFIWRGY